jgi:type I restriction enzyme, S subunit
MKYVKLKDIISITHGYAFKGEFFSDDEQKYVLVTPGNFNIGGGFKTDKLRYYSGEVPKKYILRKDDVIITMTDLSKSADTLGHSAKIPTMKNKIFLHNQRIGKINKKSELINLDFIYWLMRTKKFHEFVIGSASGSTVKHTSPNRVLEYEFDLPEIGKQKAIVSVLSSFDDKIERLEKQNKSLEKIGEALFKQWFVNFEFPNKNGKPYASSGGKMVYNKDLGKEIPAGWEVKSGKNLFNFVKGKPSPIVDSSAVQDAVPQVLIENLSGGDTVFVDPGKAVLVEKMDTLMVMDGASSGVVSIGQKGALGSTLAKMDFKNSDLSCIIYNFLKRHESFIRYNNTGSSIPHANKSLIFQLMISLPKNEKDLKPLANQLAIFIQKQLKNKPQIQSLKQTRDLLLSKLMSGKIRVN